jgi:hypothetical protein
VNALITKSQYIYPLYSKRMIQRKMARHHDTNKAPPLLLWWSGVTVTFMFVIVLKTQLAVVSRYQPKSTITMFSSSSADDFIHSNSNKNHSILVPPSRSNKTLETINRQQRPITGRFSNTWNFTEQEQHVVVPMASVFGSSSSHSWDELYGKNCQQTTYDNLPALQEYISSLDLYIVSHGGLGSNALIDHLDSHTSLKVKKHDDTTTADPLLYYASCHLGNPAFVALVRHLQQQHQDGSTTTQQRRIPPTLVMVGDFWNAFQSMKRRTWLNMNIAKNLYGSQACRSKWENSRTIFPKDPAGIKMMMLAHIVAAQQQQQQQQDSNSAASAAAPIVFLQAPYTRESILQALQLLLLPATGSTQDDIPSSSAPSSSSIERHLEGFQVQQRGTKYKTVADAKQDTLASSTRSSPTGIGQVPVGAVDPLLELYQPYEALEEILTRMPRAWKAADTPRELLDYLLEEFQ